MAFKFNAITGQLDLVGSSGGGTPSVTTLDSVGNSPNPNAGIISGNTLTLEPADATNPGVVTTGSQTFAGAKVFSSTIAASNFSGTSSGTNSGDQTFADFVPVSPVSSWISPVVQLVDLVAYMPGSDWAYITAGAGGPGDTIVDFNIADPGLGGGGVGLDFTTYTFDGRKMVSGDRVLVININGLGIEGVYTYDGVNTLTRAPGADTVATITDSAVVITNGTQYAGTQWFQTGVPVIATNVIGTDGSIIYDSFIHWLINNSIFNVASVGNTPNGGGASIGGGNLQLQPADITNPGLITAGTQTIGGDKTFNGAISASNLSGTNTGDVTLGTPASGLGLTGQVLTLALATASTPGAVANIGAASGVATLDGSGLIPINQLPPSAIERLVVVADQTARFALTTATVQNGDTVLQSDTNVMYFVVDQTNLGNSAGYHIYDAGTSTTTSNVNVTTKGDNTVYYMTFVGANSTSTQAVYVGPMAYNPSTGTLATARFSGGLSGNADTATLATNATTAATATNVTTTNPTGVIYPTFVASNTPGDQGIGTNANINYSTVTNTLTTTNFVGAFFGNASTATSATTAGSATTATTASVATTVTTTAKSDNVTYYPTFVAADSSSNQALDVGPMTYNPSTGNLTTTTFTGALAGNASTATSAGSATTATTATNIAGGAGGSIPYQSAAATTAMLANGTAGRVLTSAGTTLAPVWAAPAVAVFSGLNTDGIIYATSATAVSSTTVGTAGQVLTSNGTGVAPTFQAAGGSHTAPNIQTLISTGSQTGILITLAGSSTAALNDTYTNNGNTYTVLKAFTSSTGPFYFSGAGTTSGLTFTRATGSGSATIVATAAVNVQNLATATITGTPLYLEIEMAGGGGGGGGTGGGHQIGGTSVFGTALLITKGGDGGAYADVGGVGGTASIGAGASGLEITGGTGSGGGFSSGGAYSAGGAGGNTAFGGGGGAGQNYSAGNAAAANTGGGGGGRGNATGSYGSSGGGAGGYVLAYITSGIASTYYYSIAAGGAADSGGGTAGGSGVILLKTYYQ